MKKQNFKSIKTKVIRQFALWFLLLIVGLSLILQFAMMSKIKILEERYVEEHVQRAQNAIDSEIQRLSLVSKSWAVWDDTYYFLKGENDDYIIKNDLDYDTISSLHASIMVFFDNAGIIKFSGYLDKEKGEVSAISEGLKEYLNHSDLINNTDLESRAKGIIMLPEGPLLIAACPVMKNNPDGTVAGNLIVGLYLDKQELETFSNKLKLQLTIENINQHNVGTNENPIMYKILNSNTIVGYKTIQDIEGKPIFALSVTMNREINKIGQQGILITIVSSLLLSSILIVIFMVYLDKNFLRRLAILCNDIKKIAKEGLMSNRLKPQAVYDEFYILTDEINNMLNRLEESQIQIVESKNELSIVNENLQNEIIERKKAEEKIEHLAYFDSLTELPNRVYFREYLNRAISFADRIEKAIAVIFLDLDGFKMINDSMGHSAGDEMLREVANRLQQNARKSDIVTRIGGDEFIIIVQGVEEKAIEAIASKFLDSMLEPFKINGRDCYITASAGVALYPMDGRDAEELVKNADIAMYKAKQKGKNQFVLCSLSMKANIEESLAIANKLYEALDLDELELYYQPQISCVTNKIIGVEALLRWSNPELGIIPPSKFIPIAEQTGLILPIGEWIMRQVCIHGKRWRDAGYPKIRIAINISVKQFQNPQKLVQQLKSILDETGFDPDCLELEITESIALSEKHDIIKTLNEFKDLGVRIAIDDFGTEYSSLINLKNFPIDRIKIARPFVQGLEENDKDKAITKAVILLAKSMGLAVIAEGVETEYQNTYLSQRMCDEIQGCYYYKPMPLTDIELLLKHEEKKYPEIPE